MKNKLVKKSQLSYYLAGLIEGDGHIQVSKERESSNYVPNPRITIAFNNIFFYILEKY